MEDEEQKRIRKSEFPSVEQGNTPVEVAIKLEIETDGIDRLYRGYWNLKALYSLSQV